MSAKPTYEELERRVSELEAADSGHKPSEGEFINGRGSFQSLFEMMEEGVVLIAPDGKIVQANPSAERILGLVRSEITKRHYTAPNWRIFRPDGTAMPPEEMAGPRAMKEKRPIKGVIMGVEHPNGTIAWISVSATPLMNAAGELEGIVASFSDITDHQREKEALQLFKTLVDTSPEAIAISDADGQLAYINPAHEKLFGRSLEEARNSNFRDYYPPESIAVLDDVVAPTLAGGGNWEGILDACDAEGRCFPLWEHAGSILDEQGRMRYGFGIMHDETERQRAKEAQREVLENSLDASYKRDLRTDSYEYLSPVFKRISGFTPEEMKAVPMEGILDLLHRDDLPEIERVIAESMSGEPGTAYELEYRFRHKDGRYVWLQDRFSTICDGKGEISARIGSVRDITELKQAEVALHESERLIKSLVYSTEDIVVFKDKDLIFRVANPAMCQLVGKSENEIVGKTDYDIFPRELAEKYRNDDKKVIVDGRALIIDEEVSTPDGIRFVNTTKSPVYNDDKECTGIVIIVRDVTEMKRVEHERFQLEQQIQQLHKAESLGRMAGAIAHHFNNQLQAVMGNLELAMDDLREGHAPPAQVLKDAMDAACKGSEISRLMLVYLGMASAGKELLDLSEACKRSLPMILAAIPRKVFLETDLPTPGPAIRANMHQIQQILTNLVTNAWESMPEGGGNILIAVKTVSARNIPSAHRFPVGIEPQYDHYACLKVVDSGCGIDDQALKDIFDPFFSTKFTGRGLGLAVVQGIVKAHQGMVTVESEVRPTQTEDNDPASGKGGSVFQVFFPLAVRKVLQHPHEWTDTSAVGEGGTLLIIDDEPQVRQLAKRMLAKMGFKMIEARDGIEGVEVFRTHQAEIRCVICDLTMPRMDGWETLAALRRLSPDIPVILASGYDEASVMTGDHPERPQAFLEKPYSIENLRAAIGRVLS